MEAIPNPSVRLYALFRSKFDEATANEVVTIMEEIVKEKVITETKELATKSDLAEGLAGVRREIAESKADMIKWMFLFWIGQVAVTFGFILLFLKK